MRRWRLRHPSPDVTSLEEFGRLLQEEPWVNKLTYSKGTLRCTPVETAGSTSLVFFNPGFLQQFDTNNQLVLDTSVQNTPSSNGQSTYLLTILIPDEKWVRTFVY